MLKEMKKESPPVMTSWKMHLESDFILNHKGICTVISTGITHAHTKKNRKLNKYPFKGGK